MSSTKALLTKVKEGVCKIHGHSYGWTWQAEGLRAGRQNCGELGRSWQYRMWTLEVILNPPCLKSIRGPVWSIPERVNKSRLYSSCSLCPLSVLHLCFLFSWSTFIRSPSLTLQLTSSAKPSRASQVRAGSLCTLSSHPVPCQCSTHQRHLEIMMCMAFGKWPYLLVIGHFVNYLIIDLIVIFRQ